MKKKVVIFICLFISCSEFLFAMDGDKDLKRYNPDSLKQLVCNYIVKYPQIIKEQINSIPFDLMQPLASAFDETGLYHDFSVAETFLKADNGYINSATKKSLSGKIVKQKVRMPITFGLEAFGSYPCFSTKIEGAKKFLNLDVLAYCPRTNLAAFSAGNKIGILGPNHKKILHSAQASADVSCLGVFVAVRKKKLVAHVIAGTEENKIEFFFSDDTVNLICDIGATPLSVLFYSNKYNKAKKAAALCREKDGRKSAHLITAGEIHQDSFLNANFYSILAGNVDYIEFNRCGDLCTVFGNEEPRMWNVERNQVTDRFDVIEVVDGVKKVK